MNQASLSRKILVGVLAALTLASLLILTGSVEAQTQLQTIIIHPDGSISPTSAPIQQSGNTYTFTDNYYGTVKIQKSNVILDGAGYTLWGPYNGEQSDISAIGSGTDQLPTSTQSYTIGIDLWTNVEGVVIENLNIENFSIGTYVWTKNNTVADSRVSGCVIGILMSGSNTTITRNIVENNTRGLFFGFNNGGDTSVPDDMVVAQNSFEYNQIQFNGCQCIEFNTTEPPHNWDNGKAGNFWSDYNGTDADGDGVGDTPYTIDILNLDRYPLMQNALSSPTTSPQPNSGFQLPWEVLVFVVVLVVASVGIRVAVGRHRRKA